MQEVLAFRSPLEDFLNTYLQSQSGEIYEPVRYILNLGGKRLRPCLLLASGDAFGADKKQTLPLAAAIEVFHNFTLLHDDIMDEADSRRGHPAVHVKWNRDQAILSGDIMFAQSYELLMQSNISNLNKAHSLFTTTAKEVCVGQQMDMDFEQRSSVSEEDYLEMIRLKTSVLIGASAALGAMAGDADKEQLEAMYNFGQHLGMSFQIQDDILDAFGEKGAVGKRVGGDILQNKKTLLFLRAIALSDPDSRTELKKWYSTEEDSQEKIDEVKRIMRSSGALSAVKEVQQTYLEKALSALKQAQLKATWAKEFEELALHQLQRSY